MTFPNAIVKSFKWTGTIIIVMIKYETKYYKQMENLSLDFFFDSETDWEMNQYRILAAIKKASTEFCQKKIYPSLATLIQVNRQLNQITENRHNLKQTFPKQIKRIDIENQKIIYESAKNIEFKQNIEEIFELIDWALPHINEAIEEGIVLFNFVEENLLLAQVGILPMYKDEGYFMITDNISLELQVHRYMCSIFTSGNEKFRSLKTEFVKSEKQGVIKRLPETIKQELIKERNDLPNPATFILDSDLDFPFAETIMPVAKRKMISYIAA